MGKSRRPIDLTGQKFGRLLVIEKAEKPENTKKGGIWWLCDCDCGNKGIFASDRLRNGTTKSCGCLKIESDIKNGRKKLKDLTGFKFAKLTVIKRVDQPEDIKNPTVYWLCQCECGNTVVVAGISLKNGVTRTCGINHKHNEIDIKVKKNIGKAMFTSLFRSYKRRANRKKLEFDLDEDLFEKLTKGNCYYCGKEPAQIMHSNSTNGDYIYNGIDRLDNAKGYVSENVVSCCGQCNYSKGQTAIEELRKYIFRIYNYMFCNELNQDYTI